MTDLNALAFVLEPAQKPDTWRLVIYETDDGARQVLDIEEGPFAALALRMLQYDDPAYRLRKYKPKGKK